MKKTATLLAFLVAMSGAATASTLAISAAETTGFALNSTLIGAGYTATGGWYNTALAFDLATISANFVSAGSVSFPYAGNPSYNGFASGTTAFFNANTLGLEGKNIFWFVNGPGGYALLEHTGNTFKLETALPNTNNTTLNSGTFNAFTLHAVGAGSTSTQINLIPTAPIPEPSAVLLGSLGALGLLRRRRN
jgi:MYXO-CTERM domain-containing protein